MTEEERKENYNALIDFFDRDIDIKNKLIDIAPNEMDGYDEETKIKYLDKLYDAMKEMKFEFKSIAKRFKSQSLEDAFCKYFDDTEKEFIKVEYATNYSDISKMYQTFFSDMNPKLIDAEKENIHGYGIGTTFDVLPELMDNVKSINDLLHLTHSAVVNNEEIYQSMPVIEQRKYYYPEHPNYPRNVTTLYGEGEPNAEAKGIYEKMLNDKDVGFTDIISMKDRTLMMIRDRGHATVIDIDSKDKQNISVTYSIPKICNPGMIMRLPGIDLDSITAWGARGSFTLKEENFNDKIFDFIEKIPMDEDMIIDGQIVGYTDESIKEDVKKYKESIAREPKQALFTTEDAKNVTEKRRFGAIKSFTEKMKNFLKIKGKDENVETKDRED